MAVVDLGTGTSALVASSAGTLRAKRPLSGGTSAATSSETGTLRRAKKLTGGTSASTATLAGTVARAAGFSGEINTTYTFNGQLTSPINPIIPAALIPRLHHVNNQRIIMPLPFIEYGRPYTQPTYYSSVMDENPDAYYRLHDTSGASAVDGSGNSIDATLYTTGSILYAEAGPLTGQTSSALRLQGASGALPRIGVPASALPADITELTLMFFVKRNAKGMPKFTPFISGTVDASWRDSNAYTGMTYWRTVDSANIYSPISFGWDGTNFSGTYQCANYTSHYVRYNDGHSDSGSNFGGGPSRTIWESDPHGTTPQYVTMNQQSGGDGIQERWDFSFTNGGLKAQSGTRWTPGTDGGLSVGAGWAHFAWVFSGGVQKLYKDGVLVSGSGVYTDIITAAAETFFGNPTSATSGDYHDMHMSELAIWHRALDAATIADIYSFKDL